MKTPIRSNNILVASVLLLAALLSIQQSQAVTTNYFVFGTTTISANNGPSNPSNGATTVSGASLAAGGVVVFDGIVANPANTTGDNWGAVNLNAGGFRGVTTAQLGVLVRTGDAAGNQCSLFGGAGGNFAGTGEVFTNRVRIELYVATAGSTTNLGYQVQIDQGNTGTWTSSLSGTNLTFTGNSIALTFGTQNANELFVPTPLPFLVSSPTPASITTVPGLTATFSVIVSPGFNTTQIWRKNGNPISGATALSYTTPALVAGDNGAQYDIVVTNALNTSQIVTAAPPATLTVRTTPPGIVPFNFPDTTTTAGFGPVTDPGVAISGSSLLAGDTVVFDGILTPNGSQPSDAWTAINIAGAGYGGVTAAQLGVLCRQGTGPSQLFINGGGSTNPTSSGAPTNRVRIELYPSASGSTTNMGWVVKIDQNLSGTFQPAVSGTNLTFPNNTLPLTFGSSGGSTFVVQDPQSPVSIFTQPTPFQVVAVGAPVNVGVTVKGWSPAFQWRRNGTAIANATNQTYTLASASLSDNGVQFTVVVSNRLNSLNVVTSAVANVSVLVPGNQVWYPTADFTTWDIATPNWTTDGGATTTLFASGNNVTFDGLGSSIGGSTVTTTNTVNPNAVTFNTVNGDYALADSAGVGNVNGQSLLVTGGNALGLQSPAAFNTVRIDAGSTLDVGYGGTDGSIAANYITNNGTINFGNNAGVLTVSAVITGSGQIFQGVNNSGGTTVLSATNSAYTIGAVNSGVLLIASTPNPGTFDNESEIQPVSSASVLFIPNAITGAGHFAFTGFQTTILTGLSSYTGHNRLAWGPVIVDNPQALGDAVSGSTAVTGADNLGGLYLSNSITWTQPLELDPRLNIGVEATAPHLANYSGNNTITSPLTFANGQGGTEINVEATTGQLTIDATSTMVNNLSANAVNLNLQGAASGVWNANLTDGTAALALVKRGSGTWTMGGLNTYTGSTTISNGKLVINGGIDSTNVAVLSGGTLGGTGLITGPVSVSSGGQLSPGNSIGTLTINNTLTLAAGSSTVMEINKTTATNDLVTGVSTLTYGGTLVVNNLSGTLTTSDIFKLFSAANYSGSFSSVSPATPGAGLAWNTSTLATDGILRIVTGAAPQPGITSISLSGNNLIINGTNGLAGEQYHLLTTTNLALPLSSWTVLPAGTFTGGNFSITNIVNPVAPQNYYIIRVP